MAKITQAEVEDLRRAKKLLEALKNDMSGGGSAGDYLQAVATTATVFGDLAGNGAKVGEFISARQQAVHRAVVEKGQAGVVTAIGLLQTTITNYETNEKTQAQNAHNTPAGKSRSAGGAPQEGTG